MNRLLSKISFRLPAIVVSAVVLAALAVGAFSYIQSSKEVLRQAVNQLVALRDARHASMTQYFRSIEEDLELLATNSQVADALAEFHRAFGELNAAARFAEENLLRRIYAPQHPAGLERRQMPQGSQLVGDYFHVHNKHHPWFDAVTRLKGYYDLFLITPAGDVVYSMFKERDFASNLINGEWADSGLAMAFGKSLSAAADERISFVDFRPYAPSQGAPAAFIARRIVRDGRVLGVLALQMPIGRINQVMQVTAGMGRTGETYVVGSNFLMHSDSRFSKSSTILKTEVRTEAVERALGGESEAAIIDDYRGVAVVSAFRPFDFHGARWALTAEMDVEEVQGPIDDMLRSIVFIGLALTLAVAAFGVFLASSITLPLAALSRSVKSFRETHRADELHDSARHDEIGDIARGFKAAAGEVSDYIAAINEAREELTQNERELRLARDDAEAATQAKAMFLATMSHEIRTPMTGVIGMIDLLSQSKLDDDQRQMAHTVRDSAYALLTIINDILDFSKIEAGKLDLEEEPFSIRDAVEGMAETLGPNANAKGVRINIHVDPQIPDAVLGDAVRVRQILFNIGGNAVKFTETGRVMIRARLAALDEDGKALIRFEIIDSGIGISAAAQADLFTEFSQAESSTTRRFGGTGLGLSICLRLTKLMRGEIEVESELGRGSSFIVNLTFAAAGPHQIKSDGHDLSGLSVLFAGDEADERELDATYLRHWGAEVATMGDLEAVAGRALQAAREEAPVDVVVLGSCWPLEARAAVIRTIRQNPATLGTRFLLMTETRTKAARLELENTLYVESDPLRRAPFIRAVAVAAGRASPDVVYDDEETAPQSVAAPTIAQAEAAGSLILVAEDNMTNQNVIRRQLNMLGYAVEMVDDGKLALAALEAKHYAILLTDCHMPNMDGFELTRKIRRAEEDAGGHLPVVAITASVLAAEIERCYEAGMDDSLAKPLEMPKLKAALRKWMPAVSPAAADGQVEVAAAPAAAPAAGEAVNPQALRQVFGDDADTLREILLEFVEPARANVAEILAAVERRSAADVGAAAHKMKSSSRAIGAEALADLCQRLETLGQAGEMSEISTLSQRLGEEFDKVIAYIARQ